MERGVREGLICFREHVPTLRRHNQTSFDQDGEGDEDAVGEQQDDAVRSFQLKVAGRRQNHVPGEHRKQKDDQQGVREMEGHLLDTGRKNTIA